MLVVCFSPCLFRTCPTERLMFGICSPFSPLQTAACSQNDVTLAAVLGTLVSFWLVNLKNFIFQMPQNECASGLFRLLWFEKINMAVVNSTVVANLQQNFKIISYTNGNTARISVTDFAAVPLHHHSLLPPVINFCSALNLKLSVGKYVSTSATSHNQLSNWLVSLALPCSLKTSCIMSL